MSLQNYAQLEALAARNPRLNDVIVYSAIGNISLRSTFGLWLKADSPKIGKAQADTNLVEIPGADFLLDLSKAIDGTVHFKKREITMRFVCDRPKSQWADIRDKMELLLQGEWLRFYFTRDKELWDGLFDVELTPGAYSATVSMTVICDPLSKGKVILADDTTARLGTAVLGKMRLGKP